MDNRLGLRILISAYNEQDQIGQLLVNIDNVLGSSEPYEILVVDDGSTDKTAEVLLSYEKEFPVSMLRHPQNLGVSSAFRNGFDRILENCSPDDFVLTMEANKNADPKIIPDMIEASQSGSDLVLASCYAPGGKVIGDPLFRLVLSMGINFLLRILFPCGVHTYTSFYRLYRCSLLKELKTRTRNRYFTSEGFVCMADMLLKARKIKGIKISEVPLVLRSDIDVSGSKMKISRTIFGYVTLVASNLIPRNEKK